MLDFLNQNAGSLTVVFSFFVAISTVIYAVLTWKLVSETRRLREAQTEPKLSANLVLSDNAFGFVDLVVKNEGMGPAYEVSFDIEFIDKESCNDDFMKNINKLQLLSKGIKYMASKQEIRSFVMSTFSSGKEAFTSVAYINITYKSMYDKVIKDKYLLNCGMYEGITRLGTPPLERIAEAMEKISKK